MKNLSKEQFTEKIKFVALENYELEKKMRSVIVSNNFGQSRFGPRSCIEKLSIETFREEVRIVLKN